MNQLKFAATLFVVFSTCYQVGGASVPFSKGLKLAQDFSALLDIFKETAVVEVSGSYYFFSNTKKTWEAAEHDCEHLGGHLTSIHSVADNNFIFGQVKARYGKNTAVWIGFNDQYHEGTYTWIGGARSNYVRWAANNPVSTASKNCVYIQNTLSYWYNTQCTLRYNYICKL